MQRLINSHRSSVELPAPMSSGVASGDFDPLIEVTFPKMCRRITTPMYATENKSIVFGLIDHPPASPTLNKELP